jgi:hypothetical protein
MVQLVEVEFLHRDGDTRCIATLPVANVLVLNRERTQSGKSRRCLRFSFSAVEQLN